MRNCVVIRDKEYYNVLVEVDLVHEMEEVVKMIMEEEEEEYMAKVKMLMIIKMIMDR